MNIAHCTCLYLLGTILCVSAHLQHTTWHDSYDFIVVGGGTAGSVVAARLSEDEEVSVLVLEAGGEATDPFMRIPKTFTSVVDNPELQWGYFTEPQSMSPANISVPISTAKVLGGTGSHNGMAYVRGSRYDYDKWAEMGNYNWSYEAVLPYFKKSEFMQDPKLANNGYHGTSGLLKTRPADRVAFVEEIIKAGVELGFGDIVDINGPELEGFSRMQTNVDERGERSSSYEAFLKPVRCRRNLDVVTNAHVTKVSFNQQSHYHVTDGVYFIKANQEHFVKARRKVIVCSGAIGSPMVLMHSGIGPKQHLQSLGIPVISNLPVGENFQDHVAVILPTFIKETTPIETENLFTFEALFDQVFTGKGPWSGYTPLFWFMKSHTQPTSDQFPYVEQIFGPPVLSLTLDFPEIEKAVRNGQKITKEMVNQLMNSTKGDTPLLVYVNHFHSRTRGTIRLRSSNPLVKPNITHNYLSNYDDVQDIIQGIRNFQKLMTTDAMKYLQVQPITDSDPNCKNHTFDSDLYWECYIYNNFFSFTHYSSSCKMADDSTGVVDYRLRVKGVFGLRVADTSIMPLITSGHLNAPAIMIGEKVADMIKMDMSEPFPPGSSGSILTNSVTFTLLLVCAAFTIMIN